MDSIYRGITILGIVATFVGGIPAYTPVAHAESTSLDQQSAQDFFKQAFTKYQSGDYQGAIADLNQAIRIDPNEAKFYYSRGLTRRKLLDNQGAVTDYTLAIQTNPNYADAYYNRANAYLTLKNQWEALKDYQKAADLYLKQGKLEDSQDALNRVRSILQQRGTP